MIFWLDDDGIPNGNNIGGKTIFVNSRSNKKRKQPLPIPRESDEQTALFAWAALESGRYPELRLMFSVPNGGSRHKIEAARLKAQGVKPGVSDIFLPVARGGYHGLWLELKRQRGGVVSDHQAQWIAEMIKQGYAAAICRGFEEARRAILEYLKGE